MVTLFSILAMICFILIVLFFYCIMRKKSVHAVRNFTFNHIEGRMEKFKATWTPSPDSFVEKHNLVYQFVGEGEVVGPDLPSSAIETFVTFTDAQLGKSGSAWIRTTGDNGTVDNCNKIGFTVNNSAQVRPVENFGFVWVEHVV
jgi:hypothetical protein